MPNYRNDKSYDNFMIAMAYVPWQQYAQMYDNLEEAYMEGTIFPELNKPFMGRRGKHGK